MVRVDHGKQNMKISDSPVGLWFMKMQKNHNFLFLVPCALSHKIQGISTKTEKMKFRKGEMKEQKLFQFFLF